MTKNPFPNGAPPLVFPGIVNYTPLPIDTPYHQMTSKQVVDEIRHYITIAEQKDFWFEHLQLVRNAFNRKTKDENLQPS